jgi:pimeloyl-ACP methyl ester carboxylesterase
MPLVLVLGWFTHLTEGLGSPLYDSAGVVRWYSRDHLLVRYDGRGFGLSDRDATDFGLDARVRDLEAVVDALDLERFVLYAFSAGGPTAVTYVDRHPDRVSHLVLAATYLGLSTLARKFDDVFPASPQAAKRRSGAWLSSLESRRRRSRRVKVHSNGFATCS